MNCGCLHQVSHILCVYNLVLITFIVEESLALMPEFQSRIEVLLHLNYIDSDRTVQLKVYILLLRVIAWLMVQLGASCAWNKYLWRVTCHRTCMLYELDLVIILNEN